jgi:hypothetical protein
LEQDLKKEDLEVMQSSRYIGFIGKDGLGEGGLAGLARPGNGNDGKSPQERMDGLFGVTSYHEDKLPVYMQIVKHFLNLHKLPGFRRESIGNDTMKDSSYYR